MVSFLDAVVAFPTAIFTTLLGVVAFYWVLALLGLVDFDSGEADLDVDPAMTDPDSECGPTSYCDGTGSCSGGNAGTHVDAGTRDAGMLRPDARVNPDAGSRDVDAGEGPTSRAGCDCRASRARNGLSAPLMLLLGLMLVVRRRRSEAA